MCSFWIGLGSMDMSKGITQLQHARVLDGDNHFLTLFASFIVAAASAGGHGEVSCRDRCVAGWSQVPR